MTQHTFSVRLLSKTGEALEAGRVTFTGEDYEAFGATQARDRILANKAQYGMAFDAEMGLVWFGGVSVAREEFRGLELELVSAAR